MMGLSWLIMDTIGSLAGEGQWLGQEAQLWLHICSQCNDFSFNCMHALGLPEGHASPYNIHLDSMTVIRAPFTTGACRKASLG